MRTAVIARAWAFAPAETSCVLAASAIGVAFVVGILFWGGFQHCDGWTNRGAFCISP